MYDTAILIGRFQPVHTGHLALLDEALACARQVIAIAGSAHQARTPKNPFSWQEREAMLRGALLAGDAARLTVLPVRDYYNQARWVQAVRAVVARHAGAHARIALVGHFKDATSSYLADFPGWALVRMARQGDMDATRIRDAWLGAPAQAPGAAGANTALDAALDTALAPVAHGVPAATRALLHIVSATPQYPALQREWRMLQAYRAAWACAPYPPVFVTVDALLHWRDQVLLIRRAQAPGRGLLALPGGFIEPRETLWQSCLRELREETACTLDEALLRAALQSVVVFDHPERSQRGRTITHVHHFLLAAGAPRPEVHAGDDAGEVHWLPIDQLAAHEEAFFEDHFHMLDHFLALTPQP